MGCLNFFKKFSTTYCTVLNYFLTLHRNKKQNL